MFALAPVRHGGGEADRARHARDVGNAAAGRYTAESLIDALPALLLVPGAILLARRRPVRRRLGRGAFIVVRQRPWARGLALCGSYAFVGLSKIRETSTFGGMPIAERRPELKCGVGVVDLGTGGLAAHLEFVTGVEEIFDVQVLQGPRCPALSGPYPSLDGAAPIWTVPQAARASQESRHPG